MIIKCVPCDYTQDTIDSFACAIIRCWNEHYSCTFRLTAAADCRRTDWKDMRMWNDRNSSYQSLSGANDKEKCEAMVMFSVHIVTITSCIDFHTRKWVLYTYISAIFQLHSTFQQQRIKWQSGKDKCQFVINSTRLDCLQHISYCAFRYFGCARACACACALFTEIISNVCIVRRRRHPSQYSQPSRAEHYRIDK